MRLERSAIGAGCKMLKSTPGRKGSSRIIFFEHKTYKNAGEQFRMALQKSSPSRQDCPMKGTGRQYVLDCWMR